MAGGDARLLGRQFAFDDMQISAANATRADVEKDMSGLGLWIGNVSDLQRAL